MFAITGISGRVGGTTAQALLDAGHPVRAILRDNAKAPAWRGRGAEIALATFDDADALAAAFTGAEGVYVMVPPDFDPDANFSGARAAASAIAEAVKRARPGKVVALSSIGGQHPHDTGLIGQTHILEQALADSPVPLAILRPTWFMENSLWDVAPARETGWMPSFLSPLDRQVPMIATADIGSVAGKTLLESWSGRRVIEIEGPRRYSQNEIAMLLGQALGRKVEARPVPREQWEALFRSQGMQRPQPRIEMLDGFNSSWIDFEQNAREHLIGSTSFETVLAGLVKQAA
ncbi:nucleoside-diphosphate sugar epimerase [Labrys miyagiensis]|uniref:Nucleoside-diphosphate sugar epimerase n=1 Tax=Labrys miyagiensis TaxID=346912 RepID=A0ABQ6CJP1_9HYPH|nr:NmrA family NAD(P)-binding protein [Labrys miyagiensis]GLS20390.1 nucleoside-diphosphate sugar epimerase [Labrys miyagiensis]